MHTTFSFNVVAPDKLIHECNVQSMVFIGIVSVVVVVTYKSHSLNSHGDRDVMIVPKCCRDSIS